MEIDGSSYGFDVLMDKRQWYDWLKEV